MVTNTNGTDISKAPEPPLGDKPLLGDRYTSREFMELEWENMWTKVWLIGGLLEEIPNKGDYITCEIGRESILCVRDSKGKVRAFYNVCQHRANRLVQAEKGTTNSFTCGYHGWKYALDGELIYVRDEEDFKQGNPCGKLRLVEIPCDTWGGFIWYNMDDKCSSLADFLAPHHKHLSVYPLEEMKRTDWVTIEGDFNWKCVQDNFNESYHIPDVHPQLKYFLDERYQSCQFDLYLNGNVRMLMPGSIPTPHAENEEDTVIEGFRTDADFWDMDIESYRGRLKEFRKDLQKQKRKLSKEKGYDFSLFNDDQLTDNYHYGFFPNVYFSMKPDGNIFLRGNPHPTDPNKCYFDMWYFTWFPKGVNEYYSNSMSRYVDINTPVEHLIGKIDEVSAGPGIDQDVAVWQSQQQGLGSRGFKGDYMPDQERRIRFHHETIDRYIDGSIQDFIKKNT